MAERPSSSKSRLIALLLAASLFAACSGAKKARILVRADNYFKAGEYEKAKLEYLNVLRVDRENPYAIERIGLIWFDEGAPLEAYAYLSNARGLLPDDVEIRRKLMTLLADLGETDAASKEAKALLEEFPNQEDALLVLARTATTKQEFEEVREQLRKVPEEDETTYHLASANLAVREGELAYAQSELEQAAKLATESPAIHLALANVYTLKGDLDKADKEFHAGCALSPIRSAARLQYARFLTQIGKNQDAVQLLEDTTRRAPDYFPAWCLLAEEAISQKKYDEALRLLQNVFSRDRQNLNGLLLAGEVWLGKGETKKAVGLLESLSVVYPKVPLINYQLARAYFADKNLLQAAAALNDVLAVKSDYVDALMLQAKVYLSQNKPAFVLAGMRALLSRNRNFIPARLLLAEAYTKLKQWDDAVAVLAEGIKTAPGWAEGYFRLGLIFREVKNPDQAYKAFEQVLQLDPQNDRALDQLVELDIVANDFKKAMARADQKIDGSPNSAAGHWLRGRIYFAQRAWRQAETELQKAIEIDPTSFRPVDLLVSIYSTTNRSPLVISTLEDFISKNRSSVEALAALGLIYDQGMDYAKASDAYKEALAIDPDSVGALNNLAYLYAEFLDEPSTAVELARKARALQPISPEIQDTLGWALFKNADYAEAATVLRESVGALSQNPNVQFHFGMATYMMGDAKGATKGFEAALGTHVDFPHRTEAEDWLKFLQNNHASSLDQLKGRLQQRPDDIIALIGLGGRCADQHNFQDAAAAYEQALAINSELVPAAVKLAELNAGPLQNNNLAFAFAKRARDLAPADPRVGRLLGSIVFQIGNFSWSYSLLSEAARRLNDDPNVIYEFAWSAYSLSKLDEATRLMQRVLKLHPDPKTAAQANTFLTVACTEPERIPSVERVIDGALGVDPSYIPALMAKAQLYRQHQDHAGAIALYNEVLQRWPGFALAQKNLAALLADDPDQVAVAFDFALKARNSLPADPELGEVLGEISYKRNDFPYAIECFQESSRMMPLPTRALYYYGMAQLRMSQDSEARKTLEKAISLGLQEPLSHEAKNVLSDLAQRSGL